MMLVSSEPSVRIAPRIKTWSKFKIAKNVRIFYEKTFFFLKKLLVSFTFSRSPRAKLSNV